MQQHASQKGVINLKRALENVYTQGFSIRVLTMCFAARSEGKGGSQKGSKKRVFRRRLPEGAGRQRCAPCNALIFLSVAT